MFEATTHVAMGPIMCIMCPSCVTMGTACMCQVLVVMGEHRHTPLIQQARLHTQYHMLPVCVRPPLGNCACQHTCLARRPAAQRVVFREEAPESLLPACVELSVVQVVQSVLQAPKPFLIQPQHCMAGKAAGDGKRQLRRYFA
jgi:hypothetical protein